MATHPEAFCDVGSAPTPPLASRPEPRVVHLGRAGSAEAERAVANIKAADHVCLLRTRGSGDAVSPLAAFVRLGLQNHERVVCVVEAPTAAQLAAHWQRLGVDIGGASKRGQFELLTREQWHAHELDSFRKAQRVRRLVREAQEAGYAGIRIVLEMTCALAADTAARRVAEWGATINTLLLAEYPMRMLCDYDRERLAPEIIVAALQVHPLVLVRDELCANMFYQAELSTDGSDAGALTDAPRHGDNPARQIEWMIEQLLQFRAVERERSAMRRQRVRSADAATAQGRLEQVIEAMSDGFLMFDAAGVITECNAAAERLLGRERSLVIGREWPEAYPEMAGSPMQLHLEEPFRAERGATFDYTHLGTARTLEVRMALTLDGGTTFLLHDITDRKLLEAETRKHEQLSRAIVRASRDCIKTLSLDATLLTINEAASELLCIADLSAVIGRDWIQFWQGEDRESARAAIATAIAGGHGRFRGSFPVAGEPRWWDVLVTPMYDGKGRVEKLLAVSRDITDQRRTEQDLRRSERMLSQFVENASLGLHRVAPDGTILWANGAEAQMLGYAPEEYIGQNIARFHADSAVIADLLARLMRGERVADFAARLICRDGSIKHVLIDSSSYAENGVIVHTQCFTRDVTAARKHEQEIERLNEVFRQLADAMPQIVWAARPDGCIDYYNRRWFEYTGFAPGTGDESWKPILHPDDIERCLATYYACIREQRPYEIEYRFRDRERGGYRWFLGRALPIRDGNGNVVRWFGTCTDIDEQKRAEEKLERAVAERTEKLRETIGELEAFSYSISHDMRGPLRSMQGFAQVLDEDFGDQIGAEGRGYLGRIRAAASRMDRLIQDVLTLSRVARSDLVLSPVDVAKLVRGIVDSYPNLQPPKADIEIATPIPPVLGNEAALTQCLSNLLGNAVKFVAEGVRPRVRICAERRAGYVRVSVTDSGIGVPAEMQERIFRIFERVSDAYEGTGIGLAIVKMATERMGGRVGLESQPGRGSTFWFELAAADFK